ncbi:polysaccharide pyruvyl transferase family protein [Aromatoleum toluolicum]|uniref:Polysaccharide pyruvyl transferase domain-containing protein n=1 Tax=Aromatoleum toluolicum TaxID=90060 RepID=A0ABX1NFC9_9RHOO|nr:polysaccharide pyruvyl transferase family protein [Aromatoleum toluolicum]NMF97981.1 polysaccharide pyruvyl transferase family protein [Aromatoleum toluolicum]
MDIRAASIFIPMIGQYENIGDIILRRPLLDWLRPLGTLHIYVGHAPEGYEKGLGVQPGDHVYRSFGRWYLAGLKSAASGSAHYAFKPGEIQLSVKGLKEHLSVLPLISMMRIRGGKVVRVGSGARNFSPLPRALMTPSVLLSHLVMWRDARTAAYMGVGEVMPDLAFAEGDCVSAHAPWATRDVLVVSMRGDRDHSSDNWQRAVRAYASARGLKVWVVTQVRRDAGLSKALAVSLDAELLDWDGAAHDQHEAKLRALYRRAHGVVSDRLHVLISAYSHGALPVGLMAYPSDKIERHFAAVGVKGIALEVSGLGVEVILEHMIGVESKRDEILAALPIARQRLIEIRRRLENVVVPGYVGAYRVAGRIRA